MSTMLFTLSGVSILLIDNYSERTKNVLFIYFIMIENTVVYQFNNKKVSDRDDQWQYMILMISNS